MCQFKFVSILFQQTIIESPILPTIQPSPSLIYIFQQIVDSTFPIRNSIIFIHRVFSFFLFNVQ